MKLSAKEKRELEASLRAMTKQQKAAYIFHYYKWFIFLGIILFFIIVNGMYRHFTKKVRIVDLGLCNVSIGDDMEARLTTGFLEYHGDNPKKTEVLTYKGLYLSNDPTSEDHQYAYASKMKILATINSHNLDVVIMNREAYDLMSQSGFLADLSSYKQFEEILTENEIILESNQIDVDLNTADELKIIKETSVNGINVTDGPMFVEAGFEGELYAGVIANTERLDNSIAYLEYLIQ